MGSDMGASEASSAQWTDSNASCDLAWATESDDERVTYIKWMDSVGRAGRGLRRARTKYEDRGSVELDSMVTMRASEMCCKMQLKSLAHRMPLRYASVAAADDDAAAVDRVERREQVVEESAKFTARYASVHEVISVHLSFQPPVRGNTVDVAEVGRMMCSQRSSDLLLAVCPRCCSSLD